MVAYLLVPGVCIKGNQYGTVSPKIQVVFKGVAYASIKCFSVSPVTWLYPNQKKIPKKRIKENELVFYDPKNKDTGEYTCVGTSAYGEFRAKANILIGCENI